METWESCCIREKLKEVKNVIVEEEQTEKKKKEIETN